MGGEKRGEEKRERGSEGKGQKGKRGKGRRLSGLMAGRRCPAISPAYICEQTPKTRE